MRVDSYRNSLLNRWFETSKFARRQTPNGRLLLCFWVVAVNPRFITSHDFSYAFWPPSLKFFVHKMAPIEDLLFLLISEQMRYPTARQLSDTKVFVQNGIHGRRSDVQCLLDFCMSDVSRISNHFLNSADVFLNHRFPKTTCMGLIFKRLPPTLELMEPVANGS